MNLFFLLSGCCCGLFSCERPGGTVTTAGTTAPRQITHADLLNQPLGTSQGGPPATPGTPRVPTKAIDQGWRRFPDVSNVSAPRWPDPLVDPKMCADIVHGGPVSDDGCVTADLKCGDTIIGHTVGGVQQFDSKFYESKQCWPRTINHDGGDERVYRLTVPPGEWRAWVTMYAPCGDLNLAGVLHSGDTCPTIDHNTARCEMNTYPRGVTDRIELTTQQNNPATWYVIVEGRDKDESVFSLHVQCSPGLGGAVANDFIDAIPYR